jgi:cellobiose phosphorylase
MRSTDWLYSYRVDNLSFVSRQAAGLSGIYFPLCGPDAGSLKSAITPFLSGDIKIDSRRYLTKPASAEDLRNPLRNFYCDVDGKGVVSLTEETKGGSAQVEAGMLWHKLTRNHPRFGISLEATSVIPATGEQAELMRVAVTNISKASLTITPTFSIPIFARALVNKHDHEHVTSLLNRIYQPAHGVLVQPTMVFNERGHKSSQTVYYVFGQTDKGENPAGTFPTVESFLGEGLNASIPEAVAGRKAPPVLSQEAARGKEAMGALRFPKIKLAPGRTKEFFIVMGIDTDARQAVRQFKKFNSPKKFAQALENNKEFWTQKAGAISFDTADPEFDAWMRWVTLQPVLRRIFGCSFLPDHDYGKGGKGWRDLWQDLLSLILIEPGSIRQALLNNFAGVRIDGSNATIIGAAPGEFIADRNAITRVWMDHGAWPFLTLSLYIQQSGDDDILLEYVSNFRDPLMSRALKHDSSWSAGEGNQLKDEKGHVHHGSVIEHVLIQHLVPFFNVGAHNIIRLEDADWNDGLDMASERGESVAFTALYAGNLLEIADLLEKLSARKGIEEIFVSKELGILLDSLSAQAVDDADPARKTALLFDRYFAAVQPKISGERIPLKIKDAAADLRKKGRWLFEHIQRQEKVTVGGDVWFNGYYDNKGERVEGKKGKRVWMTLTGQVFPLMSGLATDEDISNIVRSVRKHLKDKKLGGYRLNTDFGLSCYPDLGRAFGFAYGTKENGSFFSHMTVMYAYALYKRGFVKEGYEVIRSIYRMCMDTERSRIYPGIPEYFDSQGRGRYHYLTGSASWLVLTLLTQAFGVRGEGGDLILEPRLVKEQFDTKGRARAACPFAGKKISVTYVNAAKRDFGKYKITGVRLNGKPLAAEFVSSGKARISRSALAEVSDVQLEVTLE